MRITSEMIKWSVASYWRFVRQCPVVAFEAEVNVWSSVCSDMLVVDSERRLTEIEVKMSLPDFRKDRKKPKHHAFSCGGNYGKVHQFYFAVPQELANEVKLLCEQMYPYAGVIGVDGAQPGDQGVQVYRQARCLSTSKLPFTEILRLVRSQSGTLCHLCRQVVDLQNRLAER